MATKMTLDSVVVQSKDQISCDLQGEIALLNLKNGKYYSLEAVAPRIWELIREPRSVNDILKHLVDEYHVEYERCRQDLFALLEQLISEGLLEICNAKVS